MLGISMRMLNDRYILYERFAKLRQTYQLRLQNVLNTWTSVKYSILIVMCLNFYWISVFALLALHIPITHLTFSLKGPDNVIVM